MIKLHEFMVQGGLFSLINGIKPMPFLDDGQAVVMDRMLILQYGDRSMFTKMVTVSLPEIAKMVTMLNGDKWDAVVLLDDTDQTAKSLRTITETTINNENRTNARDDKNVVSAFNDDELVVNDGTLSNGVDNLNGTVTRTLTDGTTDLKTAYNNLSLSQKNNIMNVVIKDVADLITLNIY